VKLRIIHAPQVPYAEALNIQQRLRELRQQEEIPDTLLLLEHPPVVTLGKRGAAGDILLPRELLTEKGIDVAEIDRGGQVTYHGPGQLVGYVIVNLYHHQRKLRLFVERLENSVIRYLKEHHDIDAGLSDEHVGVWAGENQDKKIAALGISISRGVTMHGFALNINCDLTPFSYIIPCGITDKGVTSTRMLTGRSTDMQRARREYADIFSDVYGYSETEELPWNNLKIGINENQTG
jgi:lipoyl(octanoyl) transferase